MQCFRRMFCFPLPCGGLYKSCKQFGANLAYISGCGCSLEAPVTGKPGDLPVEIEAMFELYE